MMKDIQKYRELCNPLGQTTDNDMNKIHRIYVEDLAETARIDCIPLVINKMYDYVIHEKFQVFSLAYRIVSEDKFECYECLY